MATVCRDGHSNEMCSWGWIHLLASCPGILLNCSDQILTVRIRRATAMEPLCLGTEEHIWTLFCWEPMDTKLEKKKKPKTLGYDFFKRKMLIFWQCLKSGSSRINK